jgi:hypothetical protein
MHPPVGGSTIAGAFRWRTNSRLREYNSGGDSRGTKTVDGTRKTYTQIRGDTGGRGGTRGDAGRRGETRAGRCSERRGAPSARDASYGSQAGRRVIVRLESSR